tara:strand:+ start:268 stop:774 length:507 start_codon:yes stop_codon:yes gene_type:complete
MSEKIYKKNIVDCGHLGIRISRDGTWFYHGSPITRQKIVILFSKVLKKEKDGSYYLVTPVERGKIDVEDAPFVAVELIVRNNSGKQVIVFRTNLDEKIEVDKKHPIRVVEDPKTGEPSPYVLIRDNLEALISRSTFYQLASICEEDDIYPKKVGVWSNGNFFPIGRSV